METIAQQSILSDPLLSTEDFSARTGIKPRTIERWRLEGKGPEFVRIGSRMVRYRLSAIESFIRQSQRAA
jgi:predicted DNA-binding transcriptional regulator AlpA